jgi:hypothetical protein
MLQQKNFNSLIIYLVLLSSFWAWGQTAPSIGTGTSGDPYQIATVDNFKWIAQEVNNNRKRSSYFKQTAHLDFQGVDGLVPIGTNSYPFQGVYDGGFYTTSNLNMTETSSYPFFGIFGYVYGSGTIKNLKIKSAKIIDHVSGNNGGHYTGILVGKFYASVDDSNELFNIVIEDSEIESVAPNNGQRGYGGLIGEATNVNIAYCSIINLDILAKPFQPFPGGPIIADTGGLVGLFFGPGSIKHSYSTGNIFDDGDSVGGLIGTPAPGGSITIQESYSMVNITGRLNVGGLVGYFDTNGTIRDCYARGNVTATSYGNNGTFIGFNAHSASIQNVYSTGANANANSNIFSRQNLGASSNRFYDSNTSGSGSSASATGKTTAQMKQENTFISAGFDFDNIWAIDPSGSINDGYPYLRKTLDIFLS